MTLLMCSVSFLIMYNLNIIEKSYDFPIHFTVQFLVVYGLTVSYVGQVTLTKAI